MPERRSVPRVSGDAPALRDQLAASGLSGRRFAQLVLAARDEGTVRHWLADPAAVPGRVRAWLAAVTITPDGAGGVTIHVPPEAARVE